MPRRVIDRRDASPIARCKKPVCNAPMTVEFRLGVVLVLCSMCGWRETVTEVCDPGDGWFFWYQHNDE